jgi:hypothetical protein
MTAGPKLAPFSLRHVDGACIFHDISRTLSRRKADDTKRSSAPLSPVAKYQLLACATARLQPVIINQNVSRTPS